MTEALKKKISEATRKAMSSPALRQKLSDLKNGKKLSKEHCYNISKAHKKAYASGRRKSWNLGMKIGPWSEEVKRKISEGNKGKIRSVETRRKISESMKASPNMYWLGKKRPEVSVWIKLALTGKPSKLKGKKRPSFQGENNPRWINDRSIVAEKHRARGSIEWRNWREAIFARDNFTCRDCGTSGVYLEPHHIIPIRSDWNKLFDINNGITLCRPCHKKTMWREEEFVSKYTNILTKAQ